MWFKDKAQTRPWISMIDGGGDNGGSGGDDGGSDSGQNNQDQGNSDGGSGDQGKNGEPGDGKGAGGVEQLRAELAQERKDRQAAQKATDTMSARLEALAKALGGDQGEPGEATPEQLAKRIEELQAGLESRDSQIRERALVSEIRTLAAAAKFHDPADAVARIELDKVPVSDTGEIDSKYLARELKRIGDTSPHLVKAEAGALDVGIGANGKPAAATGKARLAAHYAKSN